MENKDFMEFGKRMLYFAPKDDINNLQPLGEIIEKSTKYESDAAESNPTIGSKSYSFDIAISKKQRKELIRAFLPQTKPYNLKYPNKKRKWRVKKKWFNRYQKQRCIGQTFTIVNEGFKINVIVYDVIYRKSGIDYKCKPLTSIPMINNLPIPKN